MMSFLVCLIFSGGHTISYDTNVGTRKLGKRLCTGIPKERELSKGYNGEKKSVVDNGFMLKPGDSVRKVNFSVCMEGKRQ